MTAFGEYVDDGTASTLKERDYKDSTDLIAHALSTDGFVESKPLIFDAKRTIYSVDQDVSPTLRSMNFTRSHINGGGQLAIAQPLAQGVTIHGTDKTVKVASYTDVAAALRARTPGMIENSTSTVVQQAVAYVPEVAATIAARSSRGGGQINSPGYNADQQLVAGVDDTTRWVVRRLTPRECERLQGFPDDYTLIPWRGREASDAVRYKALGNAMACNVMRWIGTRIQMVEAIDEVAA